MTLAFGLLASSAERSFDTGALAQVTEGLSDDLTSLADAFNQIVVFDAFDALCPDERRDCNIAVRQNESREIAQPVAIQLLSRNYVRTVAAYSGSALPLGDKAWRPT